MIQIYGYPTSRSIRALWAAEEVGTEYEYQVVDLASGEGRRPPYSDLNPMGKVPLLVDGELVLSESAAICTWLGDQYPQSRLVPEPRTEERAMYDKWCYFVIGELEQPLWTIAKHSFVLPKEQRVPAVKETARLEFAAIAEALSKQLAAREFVVTDHFTAADLLIAHTLGWAANAKIQMRQENLVSYTRRMLARPALARAEARENSHTDS